MEAAAPHRAWTPESGPLPALYLSHGAPPTFEDAGWMRELHTWARALPRPQAVLIVSAHWEAAPLSLSATAAHTPLIYDFGGFAPRYYNEKYATPDSSALARTVASLMPDHEPVHQHPSRGLDHGAWVPLKIMYPGAEIPVVQMSLPTHDPGRLLDLGRRVLPFLSGTEGRLVSELLSEPRTGAQLQRDALADGRLADVYRRRLALAEPELMRVGASRTADAVG